MDPVVTVEQVAAKLGLTQYRGGLYCGTVRGFPVALKVIDPAGLPLALFQVRHPLFAEATQNQKITYPPEVAERIESKELEIEFEDKLAWLTFADCAEDLAGDGMRSLLEQILNSLAEAGFDPEENLCHYCRRARVAELTCHEGKVFCICPACYQARTGAGEKGSVSASSQELLPAILAVSLAAVFGAAGWALSWMGCELFLESQSGDVLLPHLLLAIFALVIGGVAGGPAGLALKLFGRRGIKVSRVLGVSGSLLAVLLGELAFIIWLIFREAGVIDFGLTLRMLPELELAAGSFLIGVKFFGAALAIVVAVELAKPPKRRLNL